MIKLFFKKDESWIKPPKEYFQLKSQDDEFLPWYLLDDEQIAFWKKYLRKTYKRELHPFARKDCSDDFACWEKDLSNKVQIIHTFASSGWEQREVFNNFDEWYQWALKQEY